MLLALLSSALLNASATPPTLAELKGLSPAALGNIVLAGRDHGVIDEVAGPNHAAMMPEGFMELALTERASQKSDGCVRQRWTATFYYQRGNPESSAALRDPIATTDVSASRASASGG